MTPQLIAVARRISDLLKRQQSGKKLSAADTAFIEKVFEANNPASVGRPRADAIKLPIYSSLGECAGATGIPLPLLKQSKKSGCPAFKWNRVDLAEFLKWCFSPERDGADGVDWSNELRKWMAKRQKIAYDKDARLVIDLNAARDDINLGISILFSELERVFGAELPAALKGQNEIAIRDRSIAEIERIKEVVRPKFLNTSK